MNQLVAGMDRWKFTLIPAVLGVALGGFLLASPSMMATYIASFVTIALFFHFFFKHLRSDGQGLDAYSPARLFWHAFLIRIVSLIIIDAVLIYVNGKPFLFGDYGDDWRYHTEASQIVDSVEMTGTLHPDIYWGKGFAAIVGMIYYVFGKHLLVAQLLNLLLGSTLAPMTYLIASRMVEQRTAKLSGWLVAAFPPLIFWSTLLYKDTILVFCVCAFIVTNQAILKKSLPGVIARLAISLLLLTIVGNIRIQTMILLIFTLPFLLVSAMGKASFRRVVLFAVLSITGYISMDLLLNYVLVAYDNTAEWFLGYSRVSEYYFNKKMLLTASGSGFVESYLNLPVQLLGSVVFPLPLFYDLTSTFALTEHMLHGSALIWGALLPFMFLGVHRSLKNNFIRSIPALMILLGTMVGIAIRGYALIYRHKVQLYPFALIFIAVGVVSFINERSSRQHFLLQCYAVAYVLTLIAYNVLRYIARQ